MADEPENLVLVMLRRIDETTQRTRDDILDLKVRMTAVEEGPAGVNRQLDRLEVRVDRIERRLDLSEAPH
jgi:hypothetical protein